MKITIEWLPGEHKRFNYSVSSAEGREPFITVKGNRIAETKDGKQFVSGPATKLESEKWVRHVWISEAFQVAVLQAVRDSEPPKETPKAKAPAADDLDAPMF